MIQTGTDGAGNPVYNFPTCILGQIYYDGAVSNNAAVIVDDTGLNAAAGFICPDPSTPAPSGASGHNSHGVGVDVPCHHGPMLTSDGAFCANQAAPASNCVGALALAGIGGSAFNPNTGHFLVSNSNATGNPRVGTIDEIDPRLSDTSCGGVSCGPVVVNSFPMPSCMPTSIVQGPGNNFLVGCGDHDGETFPPNEYVIDGTSGAILATINNIGGVDEVWYNSCDRRYYLASSNMTTGPVMGVIDAKSDKWLVNRLPNSNTHSISADPAPNNASVPLSAES